MYESFEWAPSDPTPYPGRLDSGRPTTTDYHDLIDSALRLRLRWLFISKTS